MQSKWLNLGLLLTSLIGYHEWGADQSGFVFQMEWEVISKMIDDVSSGLHPFVLLPLSGQLLLVITLFQNKPGKLLTFIGLGCIALLLLFIFLIGLFSLNIKVILSFLPFIIISMLTIRYYLRQGSQNPVMN